MCIARIVCDERQQGCASEPGDHGLGSRYEDALAFIARLAWFVRVPGGGFGWRLVMVAVFAGLRCRLDDGQAIPGMRVMRTAARCEMQQESGGGDDGDDRAHKAESSFLNSSCWFLWGQYRSQARSDT
jgi:hypothetical protein